jgi:hypothetical protein
MTNTGTTVHGEVVKGEAPRPLSGQTDTPHPTLSHRANTAHHLLINDYNVAISGGLVRVGRLYDEYYVSLTNPIDFIDALRKSPLRPDVFTFLEDISESISKQAFTWRAQPIAVLPITTYESWLRDQIRFKARNKLHKSHKSGVSVRTVPFNDELVTGIMDIYNESPVRQGKPFKHFGKDFATIKREHETFLERSEFAGAFFRDELIGFIKLVRGTNVASLMQIISKFRYRDKAPTNALLAKAVEMCAGKSIPRLHYGIWGRGGLSVFKVSQGFVRHDVPRYYVPLTLKGRIFLKLGLHYNIREHLPEKWLNYLAGIRSKWTAIEYGKVSA